MNSMSRLCNDFAAELERFGPDSCSSTMTLGDARVYCSGLASSHYENFTVASLLSPRALRPHFHAIYAYCRWADDLADETGGGPGALHLLDWWRGELLRCYEGRCQHPVMVALHETIQRFRIPPEPFLDLLTAFVQDQTVKRYQTYAQLLDYCRNSANPVGRLVLYLLECHDAARGSLSDAVCTGLQLANFWQDVARDFAIGRVYLPEEDRRTFGYTDEQMERRTCTPEFGRLLAFEVNRAREFFIKGQPLIRCLPRRFRADVELFIDGGLAILASIERQGYDVWSSRPVLSKWHKARLVGKALCRQVLLARGRIPL
jgi:squalene synthase HpnC